MRQLPPANRPISDARKLGEDLTYFLGVLRRGWRFIAISAVICLVLAGLHLARKKTLYEASARVLCLQQGGQPLNVGNANSDTLFQATDGYTSYLSTQLMIIRSPMVVERALATAGVDGASLRKVVGGLSVKLPDESAKVVEISYRAQSEDEAVRIVEAVIKSYGEFLKNHFQKSNKEVVALIVEAKDVLSKELKDLEKDYLEYRRNNPSYTTDEGGRTFIARRLDQWDQAANQALTRALQLRSQLKLAQRLTSEGAGGDAVAHALNQLAGVSGGATTTATVSNPQGQAASGSYERIVADLSEVEAQRRLAERLLAKLQAEYDAVAAARPVGDEEVAEVFYADPDVSRLLAELKNARARHANVARTARQTADPALTHQATKLRDLNERIAMLWQQRKPLILKQLRGEDSGDEAVRKAEADLVALKAKEAALREEGEHVRSVRLRRLQQEHEQMTRLHGPQHERVVKLKQQMARFEKAPDTAAGLPGSPQNPLVNSLEESLKEIETMRAEIQGQFEADLSHSKKAEIGRLAESNLRSNLERQRTLFNSVVDQLKQMQLVSDYGSVTAQVIDPATVTAIRPNLAFTLVLALLAGCGLGMGMAFVADLLDARIRTLTELRTILDGLPVLATIPQLSREQLRSAGRIGLLSHESPRSILAESYKSARTNLELLRRNQSAQVLMISSPNAGDGKSTTSSNLAISLAHAGRRVLLIDGDLRKPGLHGLFGLDRGPGFVELLRASSATDQAIRPTSVGNLDLLAGGSDILHPAELLASEGLGEFLNVVRPLYDVIIFDTSPLLEVTDPWILSAAVDGIVLVVRAGQTRQLAIERTMETFRTLQAPVLGVVVNGVSRENLGYSYGYGYGYGYGTGSSREAAVGARATVSSPPTDRNGHNTNNGANGDRTNGAVDYRLDG